MFGGHKVRLRREQTTFAHLSNHAMSCRGVVTSRMGNRMATKGVQCYGSSGKNRDHDLFYLGTREGHVPFKITKRRGSNYEATIQSCGQGGRLTYRSVPTYWVHTLPTVGRTTLPTLLTRPADFVGPFTTNFFEQTSADRAYRIFTSH